MKMKWFFKKCNLEDYMRGKKVALNWIFGRYVERKADRMGTGPCQIATFNNTHIGTLEP
jgi:hypothetical protein